jgi:ABC-type nitrate/sulfonate/bicarbonate transport system substrate-binding protein
MKFLKIALSVATVALMTGCASVPSSVSAPAAAPQTLRVNIFPGGFNWPIWVGQEQGFFAKQGVTVQTINTPNSREQLVGLINGQFEIAMTAVDNLLAYREGQGAAPIDGSGLIAVMGSDNGFLRVGTRKGITSFAQLKGQELSVDALTTGYAFVLLEVLERNNLQLNRDYTVVTAGGVLSRYNDLVAGKHAGTMLIAPFDVLAKERGANVISDASAALGEYQGLVAGVRETWARNNRPAMVGYIRGWRDALDWMYDPRNKEAAIAIFMKNVNGATRQSAETSYGILLDPKNGFYRDAAVSVKGVETAVQLREKYGKPVKKLQPVQAYIDTSYHQEASRWRWLGR